MCVSLIIAGIGAAAAVKSSVDSRKAAKEQAAQVAESARLASAQAQEAARANTLAQQTAIERDRAAAIAKANAEKAALTTTAPEVEIAATANPAEATRRRTVRATFAADEEAGSQGAIRV
jgi:type II secretory pathway pseudopilin PulG